jgi:endonuclease-3
VATPRTRLTSPQRIRAVDDRLEQRFPGTASSLCALRRHNPFELVVATVLSAQCTDVRVNEVTPALFARFPTPALMAGAPLAELEELIRPTGFFRSKARHLHGLSVALLERFGGVVPREMADLAALPGVGRKTANVVRSVAFDEPGLPVDTHVIRLSHRLGLTRHRDPVSIERVLCAPLAPSRWGAFSTRMILHGRATCTARRPACDACVLEDLCPRLGVASVALPRRQAPEAAQRRREAPLDRD